MIAKRLVGTTPLHCFVPCTLILSSDFQGDPQTAVTHLGDVVLFVQYTISRFHARIKTSQSSAFANDPFQLENRTFALEGRILSASYLTANDIAYSADKLSGDDAVAFSAWFKALFDSSSEGIEDSILR